MDRENKVFDDKLRTIVTVLKIPLIMNVTFFFADDRVKGWKP